MYKFAIARQLATKRVITNRGDEVGRLSDLLVDENTGNIEALIVEVDAESRVIKKANLQERVIQVPYAAVTAVSDVFIVDEREITSLGSQQYGITFIASRKLLANPLPGILFSSSSFSLLSCECANGIVPFNAELRGK